MDLQARYSEYIQSKQESWSATSINAEKNRLKGVTLEHLSEPALLYQFLMEERGLSPYSLKTVFIRAGEFTDFLIAKNLLAGPNKVKAYMKENAKRFKYAYSKKDVGMTFEEAVEKIKTLADEEIKAKAFQLLYTGLRFAESNSLQDGQVIGKGGWKRDVPLAKETEASTKIVHSTMYRHLKKIGLTPHMLRKLCATKLVELGADTADLMKVMGWRSSGTPSIYVQARKEKALQSALRDHMKTNVVKKETSEDGE